MGHPRGMIELRIPKLRQGSYFPEWLLDVRTRSERVFNAGRDRSICAGHLYPERFYHPRSSSDRSALFFDISSLAVARRAQSRTPGGSAVLFLHALRRSI